MTGRSTSWIAAGILGMLGACGPGTGDVAEGGASAEGSGSGEVGDEPAACTLPPGAPIHVAAYDDERTNIYAPDHLVVDASFVYFGDDRGIHRVPRCGGAAELLLPEARPFNDGLALADATLFWIGGDDGVTGPRILSAPVAGGEPVVLAEFVGYPHRLRVSGTTIVWNSSVSGFPAESQLLAIDRGGGEARVLARHRYGYTFDLDDEMVYAAGYLPDSDPAASDRLLFAIPVEGGAPKILVDKFGDYYPAAVEVGDGYIYYLRMWSTDVVAVERVELSGGVPQVFDLRGGDLPVQLLFAGGQLYGSDSGGGVVRLVDGEPPTALVSSEEIEVAGRVFGDAGGLFIGDSRIECTEWYMDPSGEPPGATCVREHIDVRIISLGR